MTDRPAPEPNAQAGPVADLLAEKYGEAVRLLRGLEAWVEANRPALEALAGEVELTGSRTLRDRSQGCAGRMALDRLLRLLDCVRHIPLPPPDQPLPCPLHWNRTHKDQAND